MKELESLYGSNGQSKGMGHIAESGTPAVVILTYSWECSDSTSKFADAGEQMVEDVLGK